ncbi:hypothetical protein VTK73DRAFT_1910 [Phialemonium thermophilum]|uniref:Uncharacterized protein n=1 Tax=Phialemonium thermophilum TaxID=223376 RepID=A0ABR3Y247_9PEZI
MRVSLPDPCFRANLSVRLSTTPTVVQSECRLSMRVGPPGVWAPNPNIHVLLSPHPSFFLLIIIFPLLDFLDEIFTLVWDLREVSIDFDFEHRIG